VFARDGHRCQYCGASAENIDHVIPRSKGGSHAWDNVVASCRTCNTRKRDRLLEDSGMRLRRRPAAPRERTWIIAASGAVRIPAGDRLWHADVREATWWVGATWAVALGAVGAGPAQVWRGGMRRTPWSDRVCFAGLGPGEVCLDTKKVVGVSQRRTRMGTLFQTAVLLHWDPAALLVLLRMDEAERKQGVADLAAVAGGVGPQHASAVVDAFLAALP
jgi:hypothetical protein